MNELVCCQKKFVVANRLFNRRFSDLCGGVIIQAVEQYVIGDRVGDVEVLAECWEVQATGNKRTAPENLQSVNAPKGC